jgi:hypothetical protein
VATGWQKHGSTAQWGAIAVALLLGAINVELTVHYQNASSQSKLADEHISNLIDNKLNPAEQRIDHHTDEQVGALNKQIEELSGKVGNLFGLMGKVASLETRADRLDSVARLEAPGRVLATIRDEIEAAQRSGKPVPVATFVDYKNAMQELPPSEYAYWLTVATIINYESKLNQMSGSAPDPAKVSRPCWGVTNEGNYHSSGNTLEGATLSNCIVDLESGVFLNDTFVNSVIHYNGGSTTLTNVRFINCRFILNIQPNNSPASTTLLTALLNSDQKNVSLPTGF